MRVLIYVVALAISAATLALSVELITRPDHEPRQQLAAAQSNVRQIPISRSTEADRGDPNNALSPVYPATPRPDLMPKAAETTGSAPKEPETVAQPATAAAQPVTTQQPAPAPQQNVTPQQSAAVAPPATAPTSTTAMGGTCAVDACSSSYRSFRASDCTYQPMSGERKICSLNSSGAQQASAPVDRSTPQPRAQSRSNDLDDVARVVRSLPAHDDEDDGGRVVVIERRPSFGFESRGFGPRRYFDDDE